MRHTIYCYGTYICALALLGFTTSTATAFTPPVDTAGPLKVRIEGPETVDQINVPQTVEVVLENQGPQVVRGELELKLIDGWRCEPAKAVPFQVETGQPQTLQFQVTAGADTYAAHYPIHAFARFALNGRELIAHPVLIIAAKVPMLHAPARVPLWQPFPVTADRELALWQLAVRRVGLQVFGQAAQVMPTGWTGSEPATRTTVSVGTNQQLGSDTRQVISIHPPWWDGRAGTAWVEFPLILPEAPQIALHFANAVTPTGTGDGVTFRVRVAALESPDAQLGEVVFEHHTNAKSWLPGEADLSRFAGQTIRLQLESHPGPKNNTSFDHSFWADPVLVIGTPAATRPFPPQDAENAVSLGTLAVGDRGYQVRVWPGKCGLLDADVGFLASDQQLYFRGFRVEVMGQRLDDLKSPVTLLEVQQETCEGGYALRHCFGSTHGTFDLVVQLVREANHLRAHLLLENAPRREAWFAPRIETLSVDRFSDSATRVYAGHGNVIERPDAFRLTFDGHRLATSHVGFDFAGGVSLVQAVDLPPESLEVDPESRHFSLHATGEATLTFFPAASVWDAAANYRAACNWQASPGVPDLAGRFVFDLWGGRYGQSNQQLQRAFRYGLTDAAVVWHSWQRWGYDYRLPEIYPPNPQLGAESELADMIGACRDTGVLFALHDNYIDLYPDAEGFSYVKNIAFSSDGRPVKAWYNRGREAQSYRYRADQIEPFLQPNLEVIKKQLGPSAYFIDVWSSVRPYDYWTADGQFFDCRGTRDSWRKHFAWIRDLLGKQAPQISESGHDQLIGWLDGAQTNHLRVDRPVPDHYYSWSVWDIRCDDAERTPWFDFAHHDRFILHGAGYSGRYQAGLDANLHGIYSDDYIATEVLTGHPTMVNSPFSRDVVRKYWLTQDVMRALALRHIERVEYVDGNLHHQHVEWSGDGHVWVNRGEEDWDVNGHVLPSFGFLAEVETKHGKVYSALYRRNGLIVETASDADHWYVNGRQMVNGPQTIDARLSSLTWRSPRRMEMVIDWQAEVPIPVGYRPFLHLVDAAGNIAFQAHSDGWPPLGGQSGRFSTTAVAEIPEDSRTGDHWELRAGFYNPAAGGRRLPIRKRDDGESRLRLGSVELQGEGGNIAAVRWNPLDTGPDPFLSRNNPDARPVDFGPIVTAAGCRLVRERDAVLLIPLPESGREQAEFTVRWDQLRWPLARPVRVEVIGEDGLLLHTEPIGESLTIQAAEHVFAYRLVTDRRESEDEHR